MVASDEALKLDCVGSRVQDAVSDVGVVCWGRRQGGRQACVRRRKRREENADWRQRIMG